MYLVASCTSQIQDNVLYSATMPRNTTRRDLLGLVPLIAGFVGLAGVAAAPAFVRVIEGQRFTMVPTRVLPEFRRGPALDGAIERMHDALAFVCVTTSLQRFGERIVFGISSDETAHNLKLAEVLLWVAKPVELQIESVDHGIIEIDFARDRLPFG